MLCWYTRLGTSLKNLQKAHTAPSIQEFWTCFHKLAHKRYLLHCAFSALLECSYALRPTSESHMFITLSLSSLPDRLFHSKATMVATVISLPHDAIDELTPIGYWNTVRRDKIIIVMHPLNSRLDMTPIARKFSYLRHYQRWHQQLCATMGALMYSSIKKTVPTFNAI